MTKSQFQPLIRGIATLALGVLGAVCVPASAAPQGQGRGGGQQGAGAESPTVVPFVDPSTLVRDMTRQQVTSGGRTEQKVVVPAKYCASLAVNGAKSVTLPDIRWGIRTATPVAVNRRTKATLQWPGQQKRDETLPDGMPGSSERAFTFTRPGPRSIRVTLLQVGGSASQTTFGDGSVRTVRDSLPTGGTVSGVKDGTSNTIIVGETARTPQTVCVSDVFVADPPVEVLVNVTGPPGQGATDRSSTF